MHRLPNECPVCGGDFVITHVHCRECDSAIQGRFQTGHFSQLNEEQLAFVELFVRNEGKITRMESELGLCCLVANLPAAVGACAFKRVPRLINELATLSRN